ncbi:MAG: aconitase/3-isopropylmalate dehydratase large subunit family protein, partial [Thermoproteota archaeon]|nr:aconitase/3-isopropylmalate dehydratase large subunit family protein [Thermoproteota archaeon]
MTVGNYQDISQQPTTSDSTVEILKNDSLTFAEKALSIKSVEDAGYLSSSFSASHASDNLLRKQLSAGDIAIVTVDLAMAQDSTGPLAIRSLKEMRIDKIQDPSKVLLVIDHTFPAADEKVANLHAMIREFAANQSCMLVEGSISHQHILEYLAAPGMIILGADSHTCQAGCVGAFATGIGSTEIAAAWACGEMWLRVPEAIKVILSGYFEKGVFARDLILDFIGKMGEDGANYRSLEWFFSDDKVRRAFSMDSRACISNASMECGAKISVFPVDEITKQYLDQNPRLNKYSSVQASLEIHPGQNANYSDKIDIECNKIQPMIAGPDHPDVVHAINEMAGMEVDQAFIGSATNGRIEDLEVAARILKGRKVHRNTRCIVTPTSVKVYEEAIQRGYVQIYLDSGAVFTNATCGACVGTHLGA